MRTSNCYFAREKHLIRQLVYEKTGYVIESTGLLLQMLTRRTYSAENGEECNEVLELIGDQVLSYYLVKELSRRCGAENLDGAFAFRIREGGFTDIKHELVSNDTLTQIADDWGITEYMIVGRNDNIEQQPKARADVIEAVLGAIALDSNWDPQVLEEAVNRILGLDRRLEAMIKEEMYFAPFDIDNAVTVLKELSEKLEYRMPQYTYSEVSGTDSDAGWDCTCRWANEKSGITRGVTAKTKKEAKKAAAYLVLCAHFEVQNRYGPNGKGFWPMWKYIDGKLLPEQVSE